MENIHNTQANVISWVEIEDLKGIIERTHKQEGDNKTTLQADTLNAICRALRSKNTEYEKRMKGVAQGLLRAAEIYECFTKQEIKTLTKILDNMA